ncbi:hypothetical protein ACKVWC_008443 [Pyricularia oryzae]
MAPRSTLHYAGLLALASGSLAMPYVSEAQTTVVSEAAITPPVVPHTNVTGHGPYTGPSPTTTGAISTSILASAVPVLPPPEDAYDYPADGELHGDQPAPYTPSGGIWTNGSAPVYRVMSDFDYQSLALALYQEWIELDLFHWGLATYSDEEFEELGLNGEARHLIQHMAEQEVGHATVLTNMLGAQAPRQCTYNYPVSNLREYIDFNQKLTRWGEAGVYGFLPHLNSGPAAQLLLQSITVEARQQMVFRQFEGLFPMPEWHTDCNAAISQNRSIPLSYAGRQVFLQWDAPGQPVGPNNSYITATEIHEPKFAAWVSQLNVTYSPLLNVSLEDRTAYTIQPNVSTWEGDPAVNSTMFIALTDADVYVTPANLTMLNPHVAALAVYQAG